MANYSDNELNGMRIHFGRDDVTVYELVYTGHSKDVGFKFQAYCRDYQGNLIRLWFADKTGQAVNADFNKGRIRQA